MGLCPICFERLKSPVCCVPCGHVFCNVCIHRWRTSRERPLRGVFFNYQSQETQSCPQCRTEIHNLQRVRFDDHEIQGTFYLNMYWLNFHLNMFSILLNKMENDLPSSSLKKMMKQKLILGKKLMTIAPFWSLYIIYGSGVMYAKLVYLPKVSTLKTFSSVHIWYL